MISLWAPGLQQVVEHLYSQSFNDVQQCKTFIQRSTVVPWNTHELKHTTVRKYCYQLGVFSFKNPVPTKVHFSRRWKRTSFCCFQGDAVGFLCACNNSEENWRKIARNFDILLHSASFVRSCLTTRKSAFHAHFTDVTTSHVYKQWHRNIHNDSDNKNS